MHPGYVCLVAVEDGARGVNEAWKSGSTSLRLVWSKCAVEHWWHVGYHRVRLAASGPGSTLTVLVYCLQ